MTDAQHEGHENKIIHMVCTSLIDDDATIRTAAAKEFDMFHEHIGAKAIDQMIPTLLEASVNLVRAQGRPSRFLREVIR